MNYIVTIQKYHLYLLYFFMILFFFLLLCLILYFVISKIKSRKQWKKNIDLFARLAHDLKAPVSAIEGYAYLSKEYEKNNDKVISFLEKIEGSTSYMKSLINDTIEMANRNKVENSLSRINLMEVYDLCQNNISSYLSLKNLKFKSDMHLFNSWVMADGLHLVQILTNLLTNAIKYSKKDGTVWFIVQEEKYTVNFSFYTFVVKDNGCGMSKEFQKRMFEPFTEEGRVTTDIQSSGLGLYIVKQLVEDMQGELTVESEENIGSCFTIKLKLHHFMNE